MGGGVGDDLRKRGIGKAGEGACGRPAGSGDARRWCRSTVGRDSCTGVRDASGKRGLTAARGRRALNDFSGAAPSVCAATPAKRP